MHDPDVVAFEIRRPWPRRDRTHDAKPDQPRWSFGRHRTKPDDPYEVRCWAERRSPWPWWQVGSYSPFWVLAGRGFYWPPLVTVRHHEPGGRDSGEVCKHWQRRKDSEGKWHSRIQHGWRWHVHHWHLQVHLLQHLRRRLLTRCAWCGGRERKRDAVNVSNQWDGPRGHWWQGEPNLFHRDCSMVERVHRKCLCADPGLSQGGYGRCAFCGKSRAFRSEPDDADRMLAALPVGSRIPAGLWPALDAAWDERRRQREGETA